MAPQACRSPNFSLWGAAAGGRGTPRPQDSASTKKRPDPKEKDRAEPPRPETGIAEQTKGMLLWLANEIQAAAIHSGNLLDTGGQCYRICPDHPSKRRCQGRSQGTRDECRQCWLSAAAEGALGDHRYEEETGE